ncbi:MAG TPA: DUF4159 domain-containing protein [Vicinamibacterales bacterium]|nr:DUF4159 domain-containing protein [Vicinamibacterales bacterium]
MRRHIASALAVVLVVTAWLVPAAAQVVIMRYARQRPMPVNYGLPDLQRGFTLCRLRYERTRPRQRKSGWWDDYPASDFNFLTRFEELTTVSISRWANGDPGFMQVTLEDPNLFRCTFLKMQGGANYDFSTEEIATLRQYLLKGGFLWEDDNWTDSDWAYIEDNLLRVLPAYPIVEITPGHPLLSALYHVSEVPQIPSIESWRRSGGQANEFDSGPPHLYGIFAEDGRLMVLVSLNCDTSDSWEREGDNPEYFQRFSPKGYAMGVNVAIYVMTH